MKKPCLFAYVIFLLTSHIASSQTPIPSGTVSGTWNLAGSPYNINGHITVPQGSTRKCDFSWTQTKPVVKRAPKLLPVASDYKKALKIPFVKTGVYGPTAAPSGSGDFNEITSSKKNDKYSFEKEHNSAWYFFITQFDGELAIDITPENPADDYDFMLFKWFDSTFHYTLDKSKFKPIRTNISRSGKGTDSRTGLSGNGKSEYICAGPGETFSKLLSVKKGEKYYLVLDNVYPEGAGHTIRLGYERMFEISGTVLNEDQKPIRAEVVIEDARGNMIVKTASDSAGKYAMAVKLWESAPYTISFIEDSSFVESKHFNTANLPGYKFTGIKTIMPKLRGGKKYVLEGINFYPGSDALLPASYYSVNSLVKLMQKNKRMIIRIEGHVNDPGGFYNKNFSVDINQVISDARAETVYNFLISKAIEPERMSKIGFGNKFMLFPNPKNESEMSQNRRVEINVISIK